MILLDIRTCTLDVLVVSFVGFVSQEISVAGQDNITVRFEQKEIGSFSSTLLVKGDRVNTD